MLCGLGLTALLFAGISRLEQDRIVLTFTQRAHVRVFALSEGINNVIDTLRSVNNLYASRPAVSRDEFRRFVEPLAVRYPFVVGISYLRFVDDAERPAFEAALRQVLPGARITELRGNTLATAARRPRYRVIEFVEPFATNAAALGLDTMFSGDEASRRHAYDSGLPTAGRLTTLAQLPKAVSGMVVSMPVYRFGAPLGSVAARRAALVGETSVAIDPGAMVAHVLQPSGLPQLVHASNRRLQRVGLHVYADERKSSENLVYYTPPPGLDQPAVPPPFSWLLPRPPAPLTVTIDVAGRPWHVVAEMDDAVGLADHLASLSALALGLVMTLLGTAWVRTLATRNRTITDQVQERTAQLAEANRSLLLRERAIESSTNTIMIMEAGAGNPIVYVNPAFELQTGYTRDEVLGRSARVLCRDDLGQPGVLSIAAAIREQRDGHAVLRNYRKDGTLFWVETYVSPVRDERGVVTHFVSLHYDITAMKAYETELHHQSTHDALTGLPNRQLLHERLHEAIGRAMHDGHSLWVVSLDLDRFKFTNSRVGHRGGDRLLQVVADRLQEALRPGSTLARLGGDEFALTLLPDLGERQPRPEQVQRLLAALAAPLMLDDKEQFISGSAGVAVCPDDGTDAAVLIERADIAMFRAKEMGGNNFQFYTSAMRERLGERVQMETAMRRALERREFVLYYQPQVDIATGRIVAMEALVRWQHPELGMVAPGRFIPLAEETGMILPLGAWVLESACRQLVEWQREGRGYLRVAVNVSARQMAEHDFVQSVARVLEETGLDPATLELELTESAVMNDVEHAIDVMRALKRLGVKLAIDDFGTGYSSLAHLKRFAVDVLKIDQAFVRDLTIDPDDAAIVTTIIALAANLNLQVISEGVETVDQLSFLREHGCSQMQGYYFSRPVPATAIGTVLDENEAQVVAGNGAPLGVDT
ncbi:bifunctional diguanylate cyclase/phosphodiesterase [Pseudoduganella umbonata]|uniref:Diguanylate cyclase (GGDEF)-like protein/PAS domain S-box-containing protein n=1 Tax=Pseudoduganella umbonata TaxID=864828 RepID=A0A7W5EE06_9BURK|nr:EAL domain-containing protein [Pseudoduganella umbonata]MBB3223012.1 diguanylate cyclase (GGDEF)-like protein/PAS domain S-box-containing protein [Pseudoduganella umbonata]